MRWRRRSASSTPGGSGGSLAWTKQARPAETPLSRLIELLVSIPGVSYLSAITIGFGDRQQHEPTFPTAGHLIAWAGLCPGQNESAGKRKRSRLRKGAPWLKTMLVQCAWAAKRQKNSYCWCAVLSTARPDAVRRKPSAPSPPRSATAIYHILKDGVPHQDPRHRLLRQAQARRPRSRRLDRSNRQARLRSDPASDRESGVTRSRKAKWEDK